MASDRRWSVCEIGGNLVSDRIFNMESTKDTYLGLSPHTVGDKFSIAPPIRRIVLACLRVERLELSCDGINQYAAVLADLIGNSTSNLPSLVFYGSTHDGTLGEEELSSIAASLLGNTRLKLLRMMTPVSCDSMSSIATALCNTSSIGAICNSNHTLKFIRNGRSANCYDVDCYENVPHLLVGYLKMNALRNKHVM